MKKKGGKEKEKRPQRGTPRDGPKKFFFLRNVKRNRDEIEAQKNQNLSPPDKKKKKKKKKEKERT